ncbi:hypothetical protein H072_192 [Dactylellina haptotyla CBS 200.50]|uniref:BTB domain-containing protein n=1 Tax=Dactylellina haptotyla (strain CBS 200.50) TaxID=1284197 RepID=S8AS08_DACHA|nr:hypothetical protein H072_192 [Dactylellina haptotyla CBS 200.50]
MSTLETPAEVEVEPDAQLEPEGKKPPRTIPQMILDRTHTESPETRWLEPIHALWKGDVAGSFAYDTSFSDILVVVGPQDEEMGEVWYHLHRAVICAKSEYFRVQCYPPNEKQTVLLPDVNKHSFKTVIRFFYSGQYEIWGYEISDQMFEFWWKDKDHDVYSKVICDLGTADFLGIDEMKDAILDTLDQELSGGLGDRSSYFTHSPIKLLCDVFAVGGLNTEDNLERFASIIVCFCDREYIEKTLLDYDHAEDGGLEDKGGFLPVLKQHYHEVLVMDTTKENQGEENA